MKIQLSQAQIKDWAMENILALVLSCLSLVLIFWGQKARDNAREVVQQTVQKRQERERMKGILQATQDLGKELKTMDETFSKVRGRLLNFASKTEIYRFFLGLEEASGLKLGTPTLRETCNLSRKAPIDLEKDLRGDKGSVVAAEYQIVTHGPFSAILKLFHLIRQSKSLVEVKSIELREREGTLLETFAEEGSGEVKAKTAEKTISVTSHLIILGEIKLDEVEI
ncbi:MAG: hypothetical protein LBR62_00370 [Puniceicoccales bacterium]|jgi:hypothetical protein|nr:hypothetical protein [Puniceicoccales bacterium]